MGLFNKLRQRVASWPLNRVIFLFIFLFAFLVVDTVISYRNLRSLIEDEQSVEHSYQIISQLKQVMADVLDAETGQRGYVITGDKSYLEPYDNALERLNQDEQLLKQFIDGRTLTTAEVQGLTNLIDVRISILKQTVSKEGDGGFASARERVLGGAGKNAMDQVRQEIISLQARQEGFLYNESKSTGASINTAIVSFSLSTLLNAIFLCIAFFLINNEFSRRVEFERRKDEFMSIASHEMKTPLTVVKMISQLLMRQAKQQKDRITYKHLVRLDNQANHLTNLINELLDVSKAQAGRLEYQNEVFDLDELVKECVGNVQSTVKDHKILLKGRVSKTVLGDRNRIGQVLINLLTNAVKYSPKDSKIEVLVSRNDAKSAKIGVRDYGMGIDPSHLNKVFDRFYRVADPNNTNVSGLGIGLYISSQIIKRHGGRIWVESQLGKGSTFYFILPYKPPLNRSKRLPGKRLAKPIQKVWPVSLRS